MASQWDYGLLFLSHSGFGDNKPSKLGAFRWKVLIMKFLYSLIIFTALSVTAFAQEPLKVISYNLQGMRPGSNWEVRLFFIIQYLEELDPDIIYLQEINETIDGGGDDNMALSIAEGLGEHFGTEYHHYFTQTHIAWDEFREGVGIVSKYPVVNEGFRALPRGTFPRKVAWNQIDAPIGLLNCFSTHLSYQAGDNEVRVQQVEEIMNYISATETANPSIAAILGGDFNTTPGSDPINLLVNNTPESEYFDTYAIANPNENGFTVPAENPESRIDYLFYRNNGSLLIDSSRVVMNSTYDGSHYPSDHLGLMTFFSADPEQIEEPRRGHLSPDYELFQNFPNPFNQQTTIRFRLPSSGHATVEISDVLGRRISVLTDEEKSAGTYSVVWDAVGLSSGVYFFTLTSNDYTSSKPCVFLR